MDINQTANNIIPTIVTAIKAGVDNTFTNLYTPAWQIGLALVVCFAIVGLVMEMAATMIDPKNEINMLFAIGKYFVITSLFLGGSTNNLIIHFTDWTQATAVAIGNTLTGGKNPIDAIVYLWTNSGYLINTNIIGASSPIDPFAAMAKDVLGLGKAFAIGILSFSETALLLLLSAIFIGIFILQYIFIALLPILGYLTLPFLLIKPLEDTGKNWPIEVIEISAWYIIFSLISFLVLNCLISINTIVAKLTLTVGSAATSLAAFLGALIVLLIAAYGLIKTPQLAEAYIRGKFDQIASQMAHANLGQGLSNIVRGAAGAAGGAGLARAALSAINPANQAKMAANLAGRAYGNISGGMKFVRTAQARNQNPLKQGTKLMASAAGRPIKKSFQSGARNSTMSKTNTFADKVHRAQSIKNSRNQNKSTGQPSSNP